MECLAVYHVAFEDPGSLEAPLRYRYAGIGQEQLRGHAAALAG